MLKPILAIALPAVALGIGLAQTTSGRRAALIEAVDGWTHADRKTVADTSARLPPAQGVSKPSVPAWATAIEPDRYGQFETTMEIGGRGLPVLVDTGASFVALSYEDAASIGIHPQAVDFRYTMQTANGSAKAAGAIVPHIRVGNVEAYNVQAVVSEPGALTRQSLLGMSFLKKLSGFGVESGRLVLRQ